MDRMLHTEICGKEFWLNYSMEVSFKVAERYGAIGRVFEILGTDSPECFEAVLWLLVELANDGELCRRDAGYDHRPMLTVDDFPPARRMSPYDFNVARNAVVKAAEQGYLREIMPEREDEEVDLGLQELDTKKREPGNKSNGKLYGKRRAAPDAP